MQCPVCDDRMKEVERLGVSIDICPGCKGVWLDRGELEKIIAMGQQPEAVGGQPFAAPRPIDQGARPPERDYRGSGHGDHDRDHHHGHDRDHDHDRQRYAGSGHDQHYGSSQNRKRGSWLGELFGGDD